MTTAATEPIGELESLRVLQLSRRPSGCTGRWHAIGPHDEDKEIDDEEEIEEE